MSEGRTLLEVQDLKQYFDINMGFFRTRPLKAVDDVSFSIRRGEPLAWSENPAAAKQRLDAPSCTCITPRPDR